MKIAILQGDRTLADLADRLYQAPEGGLLSRPLPKSSREALVHKAEAALRRANPTLANLAALPPGAVIAVPDVEGLKHTRQVRAVRSKAANLLDGLVESTKDALAAAERSLEERVKELKDLIPEFETDEVKPLQSLDAFPVALEATKEEASTLGKELRMVRQLHDKAQTQLREDLAAMEKLLS
jgi:hypothetical protein